MIGSFLFRLTSLLLRFGCPLMIVYLATPDVLGEYYMFTAIYTFVVFLIALESAVVFSKDYLHADEEVAKKAVFSRFLANQLLLAAVLATPFTLFYCLTRDIPAAMSLLLYLALVFGACANEVGRFFWNVGQGGVATRRDVARSLVFVVSIVSSVAAVDRVLSVISLASIVLYDVWLLARELHQWGAPDYSFLSSRQSAVGAVKASATRALLSAKRSIPQVVHLQILSAWPLLERLLLERGGGLQLVGAYSFQSSICQAALSLLLLPAIAETRRAILSAPQQSPDARVQKSCLMLLLLMVGTGALAALVSYHAVPFLTSFLRKALPIEALAMVVVALSCIASSYAAAISPLYASRARLFIGNAMTLLAMLPLLATYLFSAIARTSANAVLLAIGATALAIVSSRLFFHLGGRRAAPRA